MENFKSLNEKFQDLQESYNKRQANMPSFEMYSQITKEQKVQEYRESQVKIYKNEFEKLLEEADGIIKTNVKKKNQLRFPMRYSENNNDRLVAEQKITNARLLFGQFEKNSDSIINELNLMVSMQDWDSFFALMDLFIFDGNEDETLQKILDLKNLVSKELGLDKVEQELYQLRILKERVERVVEALTDNIPYILFNYQISEMSDEDYFRLQNELTQMFGETVFRRIQNL